MSAQIQRDNVSDAARDALKPGGYTLTSANTILVLGSDARTKGLAEPGSTIGGPSRSDSILLIRAGGGKSSRLSIPRDTVVDIPGHGRDKINAAYAIGGPSLTILTVEQYLGIDINHVVEVNFENFPDFIDALGGIDIKTGCVVSKINGGNRNGGYTLRLRAGENHISGKQALALARTRKNDCKPSENDLTRARRQQKIMAAIKSRTVSPATFLRLPWVAWAAPKAIRSDMAGPALLGLFGAVQTGGNPATRVLVDTPADVHEHQRRVGDQRQRRQEAGRSDPLPRGLEPDRDPRLCARVPAEGRGTCAFHCARLRKKCRSCSQVMPMPAWTWIANSAQRTPASDA